MKRCVLWVSYAVVLGSVLTVANLSAFAADKTDGKTPETKVKTDKKTVAAKKDRLRLPPHYGDVINEDQRDKIAGAFAKYNSKLGKLKDEIKTITAERDKALEDLLTADQRAKLAKLKEDAKTKRAKTAVN